jgi:hypothetical protein
MPNRGRIMIATATPKSRFVNWLEGVTLTALLQGMPSFACAALIMPHTHSGVADTPGRVLSFFAIATLIYALVAPLLSGPRCRKIFKNGYEPLFFDSMLSMADKVAAWRVQPRVSVLLVSNVMTLSVLSILSLGMG